MATSVMLNPWSESAKTYDELDPFSACRNRLDKRHYKKDSRFVLDLYTLTYGSQEDLNSLGDLASRRNEEIRKKLESRPPIQEEYFYDEPEKPTKNNSPSASAPTQFSRGVRTAELCFTGNGNEELRGWFEHSNRVFRHTDTSPMSLPPMLDKNVIDPVKEEYTSLMPNSRYMPRNRSFDKNALQITVQNNKAEQELMMKTHEQLQTDAQLALAKAQQAARMAIEAERCKRNAHSPITVLIKDSLKKVSVEIGEKKRRVNRHLLSDLSIYQLRHIANDLQGYIQHLNECLVRMLMERDELHMKQDSMLVDIEDVTAYIGEKQCSESSHNISTSATIKNTNITMQPVANKISPSKLNRIVNFVKN